MSDKVIQQEWKLSINKPRKSGWYWVSMGNTERTERVYAKYYEGNEWYAVARITDSAERKQKMKECRNVWIGVWYYWPEPIEDFETVSRRSK
jgi:hypothetical protein